MKYIRTIKHSLWSIFPLVSPLLSRLTHTYASSVSGCWVVAGPLTDLKSNATAGAALGPGGPGSPASIPEQTEAGLSMDTINHSL